MSEILIHNAVPMLKEWQLAEPVNFEMRDSEHIAIVGANGAGKTKLVDIIRGSHNVQYGDISFSFPSSARKYISENIKYIAFQDCYGGDTDKNYYHQQRWNQWDVEDERVLMSSGELRKYSMASLLEGDPAVLIIDNPYVGLDVPSRAVLNEQFLSIVNGGKTQLILVFSRTDEVPDFVTSVVTVDAGVVKPKQSLEEWRKSVPVFVAKEFHDTIHNASSEKTIADDANPQTEKEEIIRLNKVSIRYGQRTILKDLDWLVHKGERWALTGPNGSGKSTLLSLVCADNPQSYACDISLFGRKRGSGESIWDIKKHIGYVSPELHRSCKRDMEVVRIVASGMKDYQGMYVTVNDMERSAALECMAMFGIENLAGRKFMTLSGGEQRLVLLARAFVRKPDLLILDEPLHGLDNENRLKVISVIEQYCSDINRTLIMVTHYAEEFPSCITHKLVLERH